MNSAAATILLFAVGLVVTVGLVFICREIVAWYFKINETLTALKNIDQNLWSLLEVSKRAEARALDAIEGKPGPVTASAPAQVG